MTFREDKTKEPTGIIGVLLFLMSFLVVGVGAAIARLGNLVESWKHDSHGYKKLIIVVPLIATLLALLGAGKWVVSRGAMTRRMMLVWSLAICFGLFGWPAACAGACTYTLGTPSGGFIPH